LKQIEDLIGLNGWNYAIIATEEASFIASEDIFVNSQLGIISTKIQTFIIYPNPTADRALSHPTAILHSNWWRLTAKLLQPEPVMIKHLFLRKISQMGSTLLL